jgi:hypothetical protein
LTAKLTKTEQEKANLAVITEQEKQRAEQLEAKLKVVGKFLYQWQKNKVLSETKIGCYQQLEQEQKAQIEQPLPFKPPNK